MVVGITRLTLAIPGSYSLKEKRSVVKKVLDRVRARYNIAAAEVDLQDVHQRAVLGFATVGVDPRRLKTILDKVVDFVENTGLVQILGAETDTTTYGEGFGEDAYQSFAEKFGVAETWLEEDEPGPGSALEERRRALKPGSLGFGSAKTQDDEEEGG